MKHPQTGLLELRAVTSIKAPAESIINRSFDLFQTFLLASRAFSGFVHSTGPSLIHLEYKSNGPGEVAFFDLKIISEYGQFSKAPE